MATEIKYGNTVEINSIAADWDYGVDVDDKDTNPKVAYVTFIPGAAGDVLVLRDGGATTSFPRMAKMTSGDGEERTVYFDGERKRVSIDFDQCTLTATHAVIIGLKARG